VEENIRQLADNIYRRKVMRARLAPLSQKMGWGAELFSEACDRMRAGIRSQFPDANKTEVEKILRRRLNRLRQLEEHGIYKTLATAQ
jgi:hypothetical protein